MRHSIRKGRRIFKRYSQLVLWSRAHMLEIGTKMFTSWMTCWGSSSVGRVLAWHTWIPGFSFQHPINEERWYTWSRTLEKEARRSKVYNHSLLIWIKSKCALGKTEILIFTPSALQSPVSSDNKGGSAWPGRSWQRKQTVEHDEVKTLRLGEALQFQMNWSPLPDSAGTACTYINTDRKRPNRSF